MGMRIFSKYLVHLMNISSETPPKTNECPLKKNSGWKMIPFEMAPF